MRERFPFMRWRDVLLPVSGIALAMLVWSATSVFVPELPSPWKTWQESRVYIVEPFEKRGETDQGIGLLAYYSLLRVGRGFLLVRGAAGRAGTNGQRPAGHAASPRP